MFALWFGAFVVLAAWAPDVMVSVIVTGFSVAYAAALSLILMTWLLAFMYIRASNRRIDPLAEAVRQMLEIPEGAESVSRGRSPESAGDGMAP